MCNKVKLKHIYYKVYIIYIVKKYNFKNSVFKLYKDVYSYMSSLW